MSKILLIGYNTPQLLGDTKIEAAHYRTWQFAEPLIEDGHQVCLCAGAPGEACEERSIPAEWQDSLLYHPIPFGDKGWITKLQSAHDNFDPDCIVAVNFSHALYATKLHTRKPIWMDIYGDMLTIAQAARFRAQSDRGIATLIAFMNSILKVGDVFSACGEPQKHMMVGELAMAGRLNSRTFGYQFTRVILPGSPSAIEPKPPNRKNISVFRQENIADEAFVVLWCGGYNTWTDVETLFRGLTFAMSENPKIHYLSVGASTYEAPNNVYVHLLSLIEKSPFRDRFHMLGWRPWSEMSEYYQNSDVGINIDALHYETIYGTRTRLVEMMASGLPIVTTLGAELSYMLKKRNAALTFDIGDWATLGNHLTLLAGDSQACADLGTKAYEISQTELSFRSTTKALREWVQSSKCAPDKELRSTSEKLRNFEYQARSVMRQVMWHMRGAN